MHIIGVHCCLTFQNFETIGRNEDRLAWFVQTMVGATDALGKTAGTFRRTDMDNEIDIAPIDAHVERRGGDDGAQFLIRHRLLDLATLGGIKRTMMQGNR